MENKMYTIIPNLVSNSDTVTTTATGPVNTTSHSNSFTSLPSIDNPTTPTLETLQSVPATPSVDVYSDHNNGSNRIITHPNFSKLLSEIIKQEQSEDHSQRETYSVTKTKLSTNPEKSDHIQPQTSGIIPIHRNPRETINNLSGISMTNIGGQLISNSNASHLPNGNGSYFLPGLSTDPTSGYKLSTSSNMDLPSPSTSSNSSNPSSFPHGKRHGEGHDPGRKREVRLQKNRDAARECRRKKKEYIKCLEERVTGLEKQNKALIEELRQMKELYCQREDTKPTTTTR